MITQINSVAEGWWNWMWPMFWQVSVLVVFVGAVDLLLRKRIWPQVRYTLWLLILVKLILPPAFSLSTSVVSQVRMLAGRTAVQLSDTDMPAVMPTVRTSTEIPSLATGDSIEPAPDRDGMMSSKAAEPAGRILSISAAASIGRVGLHWKVCAMAVWLAGVIVLGLWAAVRFRKLRQLHNGKFSDADMPEWFGTLFTNTAKKLGLKKLPGIVLSKNIASPAVFGTFRPVLVLPADTVRHLSQNRTEHILLHELAHIKRGDLKVNSLYMLLQIVYWFNPLLWLLRRRLQHLRELCCDATVAGILRDKTTDYRETILQNAKWLLTGPARSGIGLLGLAEDSRNLLVRLDWLERKTWKHRGLRIVTVCAAIALMSVCILPMAKAKSAAVSGKRESTPVNLSDIALLYHSNPDVRIKTIKKLAASNDIELIDDLIRAGSVENYTPVHNEYGRVLQSLTRNRNVRGKGVWKAWLAGEAKAGRLKIEYLPIYPDPNNQSKILSFALKGPDDFDEMATALTAEIYDRRKCHDALRYMVFNDNLSEVQKFLIGDWLHKLFSHQNININDIGYFLNGLANPGHLRGQINNQISNCLDSNNPIVVANALNLIAGVEGFSTRFIVPGVEKKVETLLSSSVPEVAVQAQRAIERIRPGEKTAQDTTPVKVKDGLHIRAFIDGRDAIKIKGVELWYEHHAWDLPGKWWDRSGNIKHDEPTYINGTAWKPQWQERVSKPYRLEQAVPLRETNNLIKLTKIAGRGSVSIAEKPQQANDYTLSILLDDSRYSRAQWYEFVIQWGAESQEQGPSLPSVTTNDLQRMIDSAQAGGMVVIPKGVYTEPVTVTKPLTLKGESRNDCIFEVTSNQPAISVDTKGKGRVIIDTVTIKWQLATSDRTEHPFAVAVKDTKVEVRNCCFQPLGNFKRCPVAINAMGFSELNINTCRFEGFEYTVCFGQGTKGTIHNSLVMGSGHQGISLYSGATAEIIGNVVTGSRYHAVRSTGGTLNMKDNLIIKNANRGVYLGNKSARGTIANNVIIGNGTGISGFARSNVKVENNIIADSSYAGIGMRDSCGLSIRDNIFRANERGLILFKEIGGNGNTVYRNTFWRNKVDTENLDKAADSIIADPDFVDADNGDFLLKSGPALQQKQGLTNPEIFKTLWKIWKNREDKNVPVAGN